MKFPRFLMFRVSDDEKAASVAALQAADQAAAVAQKIEKESKDVGASLRQLRNDNHFGRSLTHAFRPEPRGQ